MKYEILKYVNFTQLFFYKYSSKIRWYVAALRLAATYVGTVLWNIGIIIILCIILLSLPFSLLVQNYSTWCCPYISQKSFTGNFDWCRCCLQWVADWNHCVQRLMWTIYASKLCGHLATCWSELYTFVISEQSCMIFWSFLEICDTSSSTSSCSHSVASSMFPSSSNAFTTISCYHVLEGLIGHVISASQLIFLKNLSAWRFCLCLSKIYYILFWWLLL